MPLFFLTSLLIALAFALIGASLLRPGTLLIRGLSAGVLWMAHIIGTAYLAGFLWQLDELLTWLVIQAVLLLLMAILWHLDGRPALWTKPDIAGIDVSGIIRGDMLLWVLAVIVVVAYTGSTILNLYVPQTEFDALTYRLPRAGMYYQHGSLAPYAVNDIRQTVFPMNAEIFLIWLRLGIGTDLHSGFVAMVAILATATGIVSLARTVGFSTKAGLAAGLLYLLLPEVYFQSTSIQSDSLVGFLVVSAVVLLYRGFKENRRRYLVLSGVAVGMAAGVKLTIVLLVPGIGLTILLLWWQNRAAHFPKLILWGVACLVGFGVFGSYAYVTNILIHGDPIGLASPSGVAVDGATLTGLEVRLNYVTVNLTWMSYQILDFTGLPRLIAEPLRTMKTDVYLALFEDTYLINGSSAHMGRAYILNHINTWYWPNEVFAWYGLIGPFVLIPSLLTGFVHSVKQWNPYRLGLVIIVAGFFAAQTFTQPWTPHKGRYFVAAVPFAMPFVFWLVQSVRWKRGVFIGVIALSAVTTLNIFHSSYQTSIFLRVFERTERQLRDRMPSVAPMNQYKDEYLSSDDVVGVLMPPGARPNMVIYGVMGADWSQPVVIIDPDMYNNPEQLPSYLEAGTHFPPGGSLNERVQLPPDFLVIDEQYLPPIEEYLNGYEQVTVIDGYYLFERE